MRNRESSVTYGPETQVYGHSYSDLVIPYGDGPWTLSGTYQKVYSAPKDVDKWTCWDELHPGPPYRRGGPFSNWTFSTDEHVPKCAVDVIYSRWRYTGEHKPSVYIPTEKLGFSSLSTFKTVNPGDPSSYGATGWNKFRPTRSGAEMGVFIGELKDIPRMLKTTASGFANLWRSMGGSKTNFGPKSVANHWLNTQFGWFPFLSDLRKFHKTTANIDAKLKQLRRDNGRWIRRRGTVLVDRDIVGGEAQTIGMSPAVNTYLYWPVPAERGHHAYVTQMTKDVWFEGAFRYWIPGKPGSLEWDAKALAQIYGLQPSPSLVWELTPWSWLADWCSNAGDVFANMSSMMFDNLCAKYAYVMCHYLKRCDVTCWTRYRDTTASASWYAQVESKSRVAASPFGFGLTGGDFTARQWSILSALGLTRLGR